jgi:ABC-type iron transport system FetAB permease component
MAASARLRLGIAGALAVAAARAALQLTVLGYVLLPIFSLNSPPVVVAYVAVMAGAHTRPLFS